MTRALACGAAISLFVSGCPEAKREPARSTPSVCTLRGAQCELGGGGLGVCNDAPCAPGKEPPCLKCISQH